MIGYLLGWVTNSHEEWPGVQGLDGGGWRVNSLIFAFARQVSSKESLRMAVDKRTYMARPLSQLKFSSIKSVRNLAPFISVLISVYTLHCLTKKFPP